MHGGLPQVFSPPLQGGAGNRDVACPVAESEDTAHTRSFLVPCVNKTRQLDPPYPPLQKGGRRNTPLKGGEKVVGGNDIVDGREQHYERRTNPT
jgi:hypothetical protein